MTGACGLLPVKTLDDPKMKNKTVTGVIWRCELT